MQARARKRRAAGEATTWLVWRRRLFWSVDTVSGRRVGYRTSARISHRLVSPHRTSSPHFLAPLPRPAGNESEDGAPVAAWDPVESFTREGPFKFMYYIATGMKGRGQGLRRVEGGGQSGAVRDDERKHVARTRSKTSMTPSYPHYPASLLPPPPLLPPFSLSIPCAPGNLQELAGGPLFLLLAKYYNEYGPAFKLAFGPRSFIVISDPVMARHILTQKKGTYDKVNYLLLSSRLPRPPSVSHVTDLGLSAPFRA